MKSKGTGTVFGIIFSIIVILALIGLGIFLFLDMQNILSGRAFSSGSQEPSISLVKATEAVTETEEAIVIRSGEEAETRDEQTAAAISAAAAANADLPDHHFIFVGDSRTLGMGNAEKDLGDSCVYIGATGEGYDWLLTEGVLQMEEAIRLYPDSPIILNLGVNDAASITNYLNTYKEFEETYADSTFYYMSVNPVTEESVHVSNVEITDFNAKLRDVFPDQYLDCNTYLRIKEFETVDGVHYTEDTYRTIHDFVVQQLAG